MKMINDDVKKQLTNVLEQMVNDVTIALFTQEGDCYSCEETNSFMQEMEELSGKIHFKTYDLNKDSDLAKQYNVKMVPSIVLLNHNEEYEGIKFNGIPAGHEINSFIPALLEVSGKTSAVPEQLTRQIQAIDKPVNIKVFVTLSCPHCAGAVQKAHKLALMNKHIDGEMIEAQTFNELSNQFNVSGVPKIVINDEFELVGNQPIEAFLDEINNI
ncbi:protein disulfide oxidoreductase [Haloplasma contractile]|uniref:Glutaredoxin-like protein n=1 Tax=Haloplasma contractile SSD-17B TaxID=1033810 RepID=F7PTL0_9MOLU|nr:thioredoxin family protein [Haloplasma contractile]ERJ12171.1 Glutaredoxin-like protein [Haloplasma contractile SSD-17B]